MVAGNGFEPLNSKRADLQSAAFDRFATPPFPLKERIKYLIFWVCLLPISKKNDNTHLTYENIIETHCLLRIYAMCSANY